MKKILSIGIITFIFSMAVYYNFFYINWGLPSKQKNERLFKNSTDLGQHVKKMIELREKYYKGLDHLLKVTESFQERYEDLYSAHKKNLLFQPLPQDQILERMRGYVIGPVNHEEQNIMLALQRMNPLKMDFNPGVNVVYGGFYYYTVGFSLLIGKMAGVLSLNPNPEYYFYNPNETSWIYILARSVGALSVILIMIILLRFISSIYSFSYGILATTFFALSPLLVQQSHRAGAHNYGTFLFLLGFYFSWKNYSNPSRKNYILSALFLGLSAGSLISNLFVGIALFFVEYARNGWKLKDALKTKNFWLATFIYFSVFMATNFYIFMDIPSYLGYLNLQHHYQELIGEGKYGAIIPRLWPLFFKHMFVDQFHWSIFPLMALSCFSAFRSNDKFLKVTSALFIFLLITNLLFFRHVGINTRLYPLAAILCAKESLRLIKNNSLHLRVVTIIYLMIVLSFAFLQMTFYLSLFRIPDNLDRSSLWIHANIPHGESFGVVGGQFGQMTFPPIHFLEYKLINFPNSSFSDSVKEKQLPSYVIYWAKDHQILLRNYELIKSWERPKTLLGIPFSSKWVHGGNVNLSIYKKIQR